MPEEIEHQEGADAGAGAEDKGGASEVAEQDSSIGVPDKFKGADDKETLANLSKGYSELEKQLSGQPKGSENFDKINERLEEMREMIKATKESSNESGEDEYAKIQKDELRKQGVVFAEDLEKVREEAVKDTEFKSEIKTLEKELDGKDGRPKFDPKEIGSYALENNLTHLKPLDVYRHKHFDTLMDWGAKKAIEKNKAPGSPEGGRTNKGEPKLSELSKIDDDKELRNAIAASLEGRE